LVTAVLGPNFWTVPSPFGGIPWNLCLLIVTLICGGVTLIDNWARISYVIYHRQHHYRNNNQTQNKFGNKTQNKFGKFNYLVAFSRFAPFLLLCLGFFVWMALSPSNIMQRHPRAISWVMGFLFCKLVTALMVAHITNDQYHPLGKTVWLVAGVAMQYVIQMRFAEGGGFSDVSLHALTQAWGGGRDYNMHGLPTVPLPTTLVPLPELRTQEDFVLYELLLITGVSYFHYVLSVVIEVSEALGIKCFTIPYPNKGCKT